MMGSIRPLSDEGGRSTVQEGIFLLFGPLVVLFLLNSIYMMTSQNSYLTELHLKCCAEALWLTNLLLLFVVKQLLNVFY